MLAATLLAVTTRGLEMILPKPSVCKAVNSAFKMLLALLPKSEKATVPAAAAAFIGAATAGLLASFIKNYNGYPRISLTVPSIVIMVPGLYLYRAIYNFGIMSLTEAVSWFTSAIMIIVALPLGLIFARIITDRTFRYCT